MQTLVKTFAKLIVIILVFSSCGRLPQKPSIDACAIITEENVSYCINNLTGEEYDIQLQEMNKFTCFSPDDYGLLMLYVKLLQRYTPKRVDRKLNAMKKINTLHNRRVDGI